MRTKEFLTKAESIILFNGGDKLENNNYIVNTVFGDLKIILDPAPRIKLYTIFMRFTQPESYDHNKFRLWYSERDKPSKNSLKWNIHNSNPEYVLDLLEERVNNLVWLKDKENQRLTELI